jgi:hypothetical protein
VSLTLTHHDEERVTHPSEKTPHLGRCTALTTVVSLLTPCPQQTPASSPQQSTRAPASTPAPTRDTQAVTMQKLKNAIKGHRHGDRADEVSVRGACVSSTLPGHVRAHACGALACAMRAAACGPPARHVHIAPRVQRSTLGAESDRRPGTHTHTHTHTHTQAGTYETGVGGSSYQLELQGETRRPMRRPRACSARLASPAPTRRRSPPARS